MTLYHMQQLSIAILREKRAKSINDLGFINLPPRLFQVAPNVLDASYCDTINFGLFILLIPSSEVWQTKDGVAHSGPNTARPGSSGLQVLKNAEPGIEM